MKCVDMYSPRDWRNLRNFNGWCLATAVVFVGATIALSQKFLALRGPVAFALVGLTVAMLIGTVMSFLRFLREADELQRKIQVDALGVGFAAGAVFTIGYRLCERLGAPKLDVDDGFLVMMLAWVLGQYLGYRRYAGDAEVEA